MKKSLWITMALGIALGILAAATVPAAPASAPSPQTDLAALHQAIFAPAPEAAGLPPGAQPMLLLCSPPTAYFCVNEQCQCQRERCAGRGVKSFTCNETTHVFSCVCN